MRFHIASSKPEIQATVDLKTVITLLSERQQAMLENTRLILGNANIVSKQGEPPITGNADLGGNIFVNWNEGRLKTDNLNLKSDLKGGEIPGGGTDLKISGNTDLNWKKETLILSNMDVTAYDMHITGNSNADRLFSNSADKSRIEYRRIFSEKTDADSED